VGIVCIQIIHHINNVLLCFFSGQYELEFTQLFSFGCLQQLISWAKVKQVALRSVGECNLPTDLTSICHTVIRQHYRYCNVAGSSSGPEWQLKSQLPEFCTINRAVRAFSSAPDKNCCAMAKCLYVTQAPVTHVVQTVADRVRTHRQHDTHDRQQERLCDASLLYLCLLYLFKINTNESLIVKHGDKRTCKMR